jgi:hypothetical protein
LDLPLKRENLLPHWRNGILKSANKIGCRLQKLDGLEYTATNFFECRT